MNFKPKGLHSGIEAKKIGVINSADLRYQGVGAIGALILDCPRLTAVGIEFIPESASIIVVIPRCIKSRFRIRVGASVDVMKEKVRIK